MVGSVILCGLVGWLCCSFARIDTLQLVRRTCMLVAWVQLRNPGEKMRGGRTPATNGWSFHARRAYMLALGWGKVKVLGWIVDRLPSSVVLLAFWLTNQRDQRAAGDGNTKQNFATSKKESQGSKNAIENFRIALADADGHQCHMSCSLNLWPTCLLVCVNATFSRLPRPSLYRSPAILPAISLRYCWSLVKRQ